MILLRKTRRIRTQLLGLTLLGRAINNNSYFFTRSSRQLRRKCKCVITGFLVLVCLIASYNEIWRNAAARNVELIGAVVHQISNPNRSVLYGSSTVIFEPWPPSLSCHENGSILALFMVVSSPTHFERRDAIRSTFRKLRPSWENSSRGAQPNESTRWSRLFQTLFFVGVPNELGVPAELEEEWQLHGDLVVDNMIDSYFNLTVKTLRMLKWVLHHCGGGNGNEPQVGYVVKLDDDVFLNMPTLFNSLLTSENPLLMAGIRHVAKGVVRDPMSKWFTPSALYPAQKFPDYLSGVAYVLGLEAARKLFEESKSVPLLHLEDVYLTGLLAERIGLPREQLGRHYETLSWHQPFTGFPGWNLLDYIIFHPVSPAQFRCWMRCTMEEEECTGFWKFWTHVVFSVC